MVTKRFKNINKLIEGKQDKALPVAEALELLKKCPKTKFDESVELSVKLGIDSKKADQQVRGTVSLPHGTGKNIRVLVFAKGEKIKEALAAGAEEAGDEALVEKVKGGFEAFDAVVATPEMMREVGKLGKILGPKGLMPAPKAGTVTNEVGKTVKELKAGKVEFKVDKNNLINNMVGKLSFSSENLTANIRAFMEALQKARPSSAKGVFLLSLYMSSTMGPGFKIDLASCLTL
ncbi:MAG: 50S ribosomal protein L1 [Parachlamydiales bacterium]|jgi:large subunit ribosomal protein L1